MGKEENISWKKSGGGINAVSLVTHLVDHLKPQGSTDFPLNSSLRVDATEGPTRKEQVRVFFASKLKNMRKSNWTKKAQSIKNAILLFQAELLWFWSCWIFVSLFIVILSTKSDTGNICVYSNTFHHHNKPNKLPQATPISSHPPFAILRLWTSSYSLWPSSTASSSPRLPPGTIRDEVVVEVEMMSGIQFGILFVVCHPGPKKGWFLLRKPCWIYKVSYISMRGPHIQTQAGQLIAL